jgi:hypothetical protein
MNDDPRHTRFINCAGPGIYHRGRLAPATKRTPVPSLRSQLVNRLETCHDLGYHQGQHDQVVARAQRVRSRGTRRFWDRPWPWIWSLALVMATSSPRSAHGLGSVSSCPPGTERNRRRSAGPPCRRLRGPQGTRKLVVDPREYGAADQAIEERPNQTYDAADRRNRVPPVDPPEEHGAIAGPVECDDPPRQEEQSKPPEDAASERKRLDVELHVQLPSRMDGCYPGEGRCQGLRRTCGGPATAPARPCGADRYLIE